MEIITEIQYYWGIGIGIKKHKYEFNILLPFMIITFTKRKR